MSPNVGDFFPPGSSLPEGAGGGVTKSDTYMGHMISFPIRNFHGLVSKVMYIISLAIICT